MSLRAENLNYIYNEGTAMETYALKNVSFEIQPGELVGIIGHTGSGKSTLIQHFNGLLKATSGNLYFNGENVYGKGYDFKELRRSVGLVFQYPEYQLFEKDVITDVMFGPKNLGLSKEEQRTRAEHALEIVGINQNLWDKSPFELSGGEKRRVAIAGVFAMHPDYLVLDEPTAGLDPRGREDLLRMMHYLQEKTGMAVVLVSHSMDDVAEHAQRIIVINNGELLYDDTPREIFRHYKELESIGLSAPQMTYVVHELRKKGLDIPEDLITVDEVKDALLKIL